MWLLNRRPVIPVLRLTGPIGMATPLQPGLSLATVAGPIEKAFSASKAPLVAICVNSPGGSPVQSNLIFSRIRQLAEEKKKKVLVFCEDVAASGGYFLSLAGDEIYADPSSIIGSIGVISASFGFDKAIERLSIERRVYTAGLNKGSLDPFQPENPDDIERLKAIQRDIHDVFIGIVKERRAGKLRGADDELFSGAFWSGPRALEYGLIDGIADLSGKIRELYGDKAKLKLIEADKGWLSLKGGRRGAALSLLAGQAEGGHGLANEVMSAVEERALWSRYGL